MVVREVERGERYKEIARRESEGEEERRKREKEK